MGGSVNLLSEEFWTRLEYGGNHLLIKEPNICDPTVKQYSGYFTVNATNDRKYFFWFFEARNSPSTSPTTLWLSGGPGASSILGLLMENGPCGVLDDGVTTQFNDDGWNHASNMVWLDQPAGTGYSMGKHEHSLAEVRDDLYSFIQAFFHHFPQYNRDFHITGESFAGHYIPAIADKIVKENENIRQRNESTLHTFVDLRGMAIGNGDTDTPHSAQYMAQMAFAAGVVNRTVFDKMIASVPSTTELMLRCAEILDKLKEPVDLSAIPQACWDANMAYMVNIMLPVQSTGRNIYDLRLNGTYNLSRYTSFLNTPEIMKALGALKNWTTINVGVTLDLYFDDAYRIYNPEVERVLDSGIKVLIYAGDQDYICNWLVGDAWTKRLQWRGANDFAREDLQPYTIHNDAIGEIRRKNNLAFIRVYNAGHMVPHDQPRASLLMIENFLSGDMFASS
ncbi:hypothetical protein FOL47_005376 [Perkinsus chesapeaki]|uniref:Uncharacterized protein n=1 Tax=Perkinsus chesapeaki TaxID=330153 RepID=A0A7J6N3E9_PERCH|nr:hypothetical protein FOL47_005376 [Perkinsus chesapeaki]